MKLLRRNTVRFMYYVNTGKTSDLRDGKHTGESIPIYADPVYYRGNISAPYGTATDNLFGIKPTINVLAVALKKQTRNHAEGGD